MQEQTASLIDDEICKTGDQEQPDDKNVVSYIIKQEPYINATRRLGSRTFERTLDNGTKEIILSGLSIKVVMADDRDGIALAESIGNRNTSK